MSLAQDIASAVSRLLAPFLGNAQKQLEEAQASLKAAQAQVATLQAAATADHAQIAGLQAKATLDAAAIADLKAKLAAAQAPSGHEPDPEPEHEADSPEGYSVAPGGQTITKAGHRARINLDGKNVIDDKVEESSSEVVSLTLHNGELIQKNRKGDFWTQPWTGGPGVQVADPAAPPVVVPPPAPTDGVMRDFKGLQLIKDRWDLAWAPAYWPKEVSPWLVENAKVVGSDITLTVNPQGGASIQTNEDQMFTSGRASIEATCGPATSGVVNSPIYLFGTTASADELDFELTKYGMQLTVHTDGQGDAGNVWTKIIPGDYSGRHTYGIEYRAGQVARFWMDDKLLAEVTPAQTLRGLFPKTPMKAVAEIWESGNEAWVGPRIPGVVRTLTLHRYGLQKSA